MSLVVETKGAVICTGCEQVLTAQDLAVQTQVKTYKIFPNGAAVIKTVVVITTEKLHVPLCLKCNVWFDGCKKCGDLLSVQAVVEKEVARYESVCRGCKNATPLVMVTQAEFEQAELVRLSSE